MTDLRLPKTILNHIGGDERPAASGRTFDKLRPADGQSMCAVARSESADVEAAVVAAKAAQPAWAEMTPVARGDILRATAIAMQEQRADVAKLVADESGKSLKDATGETGAAIEMGFFVAGEGRRYYGHTTTSAVPNKAASIVRQPLGVAGLIIAANTPIANVAWKAFPALLCGNGAVLKAAEDTPASAWAFARLLHDAGAPPGIFNVVHGYGEEAGAPVVDHPDVAIVSFTGSCAVGRLIAESAGRRLAKVCLELGGKNPLVVCDDADLDLAVQCTIAAAFSNAGQRCAAGSRILVFDAVYDRFRQMLVDATSRLTLGVSDDDDYGPVINLKQLDNMLAAIGEAKARGAVVVTGGSRMTDPDHRDGYYMEPTIIESVRATDEISKTELFGPITCLYRVSGFDEALAMANDSPFGLTASIHTKSVHRAQTWVNRVQAGVAIVNGPTHGSEPHMPFGGLRQSGNGFREAGREALDVYSDWKTVYVNHDPSAV